MATRSELFAEAIGMVQQIQDLDQIADTAEIARDAAAAGLEQAKAVNADMQTTADAQQATDEATALTTYNESLNTARSAREAKRTEGTAIISAAADKAQAALNDANNARTAVESKQAEILAKMKEALAAPAE